MKKYSLTSRIVVTATALFVVVVSSLSIGQVRRPAAPPAINPASYLPPSDGVAIVDVKRILSETMPAVLGGDAGKLAQANAEIDKFKAKTGVDLRSVDRITIGTRYTYPTPKVTKLETVAIARGTFNAQSISASVPKGSVRDEKYRGRTITIVQVNEDLKLLGLWTTRINDLAICVLDPNTAAIGSLATVRAAIDAGKTGRAPADLMALASRDENAVIGFAGNLTKELLTNVDVGNDVIAKDVSAIKQVYGTVGSAQGNVAMTMVARTDSIDSAKNLGDTIEGLRQLGGIFIMRMAEPRKSLAESALSNLKITTRGTELEIRTQVTAASLAALIK